jgi:CheY-like chemotaxis protein
VTSVLVVHGRPADREPLATVLGNAGYAVAEAATGELAIAFARSQRPDLIITHILMPDMDGYELVNKLRSEQVTADIRVIFYTATYLMEEVRQLAGACGVSQILVKPCEPEEIICAVSEALSTPQVARVALTSEEFHREHLRVLNTKLDQKIDELHDVERQATESLTLLEAIQSSAPVGFGFVDREYRLRRVNDVLAAVAGAPVEQLLGREVADVVPRLWAQIDPAYEHVLATGEVVVNQQVQGETSAAPGEIRSWLANYYPVWIEGEISGVGVVRGRGGPSRRAELSVRKHECGDGGAARSCIRPDAPPERGAAPGDRPRRRRRPPQHHHGADRHATRPSGGLGGARGSGR